MRSSSSSFVVVALHLLLFTTTISITTTNAQQVFVSDLELTTDVGKFSSPTDLTFLSDGTLLVTSKSGLLQQSQPPYDEEKKIILDISSVVCTNGERGLSSVEVHPDFDNNGYLYLFYPYAKYGNCNEDANDGPVNRLSRFTYHRNDGDSVIDASTEVVFFETPSLLTDHHNGGDIAFGPSDGYLYVTLGDAGDQSTPQDNSNLFGSILRLTDDNEIPEDNPFVNNKEAVRCHEHGQSYHPDQPCLEIFAWGLRNPFKFSMNPSATKKTEFYVNDVGAASWEEVSVGGTDYVGANYGWPAREGYCKQGHNCGETCGKDESSSSSFYYEPPLHAYNHFGDDAAVTAGTFVTTDSSWSDDYNGKYLYADFVSSTVFRLDYTGKGDVTSCPVVSNYTAVPLMEYAKSDIAVMKFFANTLYLLSRGFGGRLHTLSYVGAGTNRAPQAKITTNATTVVAVGDVLRLSAVESIDPDEGDTTKLKYEWDFNNDGVVDSREMEPVVSFDEVGVHVVSLKVRDGKGGRTTDTIEIGVGTPPTATMLIPQEGHLFQVGESFVLTAESTDDDDANTITFSWEVRQHHSTHYHPYLEPTEGNFVPLQASPAPEDFLATTNSYLEVRLTVTNRRTGLFSVLSRNVMPQLITVHIDSSPVSNQTVVVDDYEVTTPVTFVTWASHSLSLQATDFGYDDNNYQFQSWSHGAAQKHLMRMPNNPNVEPRFVVNYVRTNTMSPTTTTTMAPTTKSPTAKPTTISTLFSPSFNATTILESAMSHNPTTTVVSSPTFRPTTRMTPPPPTTLEPTTTTMSPSTRNPIFIFPPRPFQSNNDNNGQPSTNNNTMAIIFSSLGACFLTMITCVGCLLVLQHKKKKRRRRGNKNKNVVLLPLYNDNDETAVSKKMQQQQQHDTTDILPILEVSFEECSNATRSISPMNDDEEEDVKNESFFPTTTNDTNNNDNNNHDKVPPTTTTTELLVVEETTTDTPSSSTCSTTSTPASSDTTTNSRAASSSQSSPTLLIPQDGGGTTEIFLEDEEEGPNAYTNSTFDATTEEEEGETKMHDSSLSLSKEFDEEALLEWAQRQLLLTVAQESTAAQEEEHDRTTKTTTIPTSPTKVRTLASSSMISSCPSDERKKKTTTTAAPQDEPPATKTTTIPTSPTKVRTLASSSMMEQKQQQENNITATTTTTPTRRIISSQQAATTTIMTPAEISYNGVVMDDTDTTTTPKPADLSHKGAVLDELSSSDHSSSCRRNSNNNSTRTTNNNTTPAQEFKILSSSLEEEIPTTTDDDNDDSNNATTTTKLSPLEWAQQQQVVLQDADADDAMEMTSDLPNEATTTPAKEEFKPLYEHYFNT